MRNGHKSCWRRFGATILLAGLLAGCGGKAERAPRSRGRAAPSQAVLDAGYVALESQQYNEAIAKADEFLAGSSHGAGSAEALYLKGRGFEGKNLAGVEDAAEAAANLQSARTAYTLALSLNPRQPLDAYLRTSLGNVAYFQDDYRTAIAQLTTAYDNLDRDDLKAWALYRVGLCQQRLGNFADADRTFATVVQRHPQTIPAQRASEHRGATAFYVQLATFASPAAADKAIAELKREGVRAARVAGPEGRAFLRVGPISSYAQAQYTKNRFRVRYPDALVLP
jgi:TolA-binding protein